MSEDFSAHITHLLNSQAVATALGVASRTGLLKALRAEPEAVATIAQRASLSARYVQEILAVLVCGKVVELSDGGEDPPQYSLPPARADALGGMGIYFEELPLLSQCAFEQVSDAAVHGAGVDASHYSSFSTWMGRLADTKHERILVDKFLPALAGGSTVKWGGVDALRTPGVQVCDLGCGHGTVALLIAQAFPTATVVGLDVDATAIAAATRRAAQLGMRNVEFHIADATALGTFEGSPEGRTLGGQFDLVTAFDSIHDLSDPAGALGEARRLLKPDSGVFAMVDIRARSRLRDNLGHPMASFLYAVSLMHCMPQGLNCDGTGLGMMWGRERALAMLSEAGLEAEVLELEFDSFNDLFLCKAKKTAL